MHAREFAEWLVEVVSGRLDAVDEDLASMLSIQLPRSQSAARWNAILHSMRPTLADATVDRVEVAHGYLARAVVRAGDRTHRVSARTGAGRVTSFAFSPSLPNASWTDRLVASPVGSLRVRDYGGEGRPILLFHCGLSDVSHWDWMAGELPGHCIALDLRAHGCWPAEVPFSFDGIADDVRVTMEALHLTDVTLVGHSLGGYAALAVSRRLGIDDVVTLDGPNTLRYVRRDAVPADAPEWRAVGDALVAYDHSPVPRSGWVAVLCDTQDHETESRPEFGNHVRRCEGQTEWIESAHPSLVAHPGTATPLLQRLLGREATAS